MKISDITVGERARTSAGWLDDLQRSIEQVGVLQPIGVTPENELIFGHRRVMACQALGMEDIPARILDINPDDPAHVLRMEQAENNIRKDFTASERVEIARRIEVALAGRQGERSDLSTCANICTSDVGEKTRDIAAKSVGWSGETYRKAKKVIESGDEELKESVDSGEMSVNRAYKQATQKTTPKTITVRLAYSIAEDASSIITRAGGDYATKLALEILKREGHEVHHDQH
jgi:ParB family chromosome partitioning protein